MSTGCRLRREARAGWRLRKWVAYRRRDPVTEQSDASVAAWVCTDRQGQVAPTAAAFLDSYKCKGNLVNKQELIDAIAESADLSKASAGRALDATLDAIRIAMKKGGTISLVGFGTFYIGKRAARTGRNPRTGDPIKIKAAKVPKFRPGKALKDAIN